MLAWFTAHPPSRRHEFDGVLADQIAQLRIIGGDGMFDCLRQVIGRGGRAMVQLGIEQRLEAAAMHRVGAVRIERALGLLG